MKPTDVVELPLSPRRTLRCARYDAFGGRIVLTVSWDMGGGVLVAERTLTVPAALLPDLRAALERLSEPTARPTAA